MSEQTQRCGCGRPMCCGCCNDSDTACLYPAALADAEKLRKALRQITGVFNGAGISEASETMADKMYSIAAAALVVPPEER